jgi:glycosyltransferase involved in cell wall biosynthesis
MKVLFISRATLFSGNGGDTVQIKNTALHLQKIGVDVVIELCDNKSIDYTAYDLIHFFNIIRPADIIYHIDKSGLPYVVSSIYLEYKDQTRHARRGFKDKLLSLFSKNAQEYIKCIARAVMNDEKIVSRKYLFIGHKNSIRYVLKQCRYLLPNSHSEYCRLKQDFPEAGRYAAIPNAIDTEVYNISEKALAEKRPDSVLCIARFEPRKNQLNIIKALASTPYRLTFAGNIAPNHKQYYQDCRTAAGDNVEFLDFVPEGKILELYRDHKVHILPSWFETTGLSSLEAAACGCNIVISKMGDTEEYFGNHAFYCYPGSTESIRHAVEEALNAAPDKSFMERVHREYNWDVTAAETLKVYKQVLIS